MHCILKSRLPVGPRRHTSTGIMMEFASWTISPVPDISRYARSLPTEPEYHAATDQPATHQTWSQAVCTTYSSYSASHILSHHMEHKQNNFLSSSVMCSSPGGLDLGAKKLKNGIPATKAKSHFFISSSLCLSAGLVFIIISTISVQKFELWISLTIEIG